MGEEKKEFQFKPADGEVTNSNKGYFGQGQSQYPNGDIYDGEYVNGVREGQGKYTYFQPEIEDNMKDYYLGQFKYNQKHGIGKMVYPQKNEQYYGQFENGLKSGEGLYTYSNKNVYSGQWKSDMKHGQGTFVVDATQMKYKGSWHENYLIDGEWIYPNGQIYQGKFENNIPIGQGIWKFPNGNQIQGDYSQRRVPIEGDMNNIELDWKQ